MLQSRVFKFLIILSCVVILVAAQDANVAETPVAGAQQTAELPSQRIVEDEHQNVPKEVAAVEQTSAQSLVLSSSASTESSIASIPSSTSTSVELSNQASSDVSTAVSGSVTPITFVPSTSSSVLNLASTPSTVVISSSSSSSISSSLSNHVSSSTSVQSSTSSEGLVSATSAQVLNPQVVESSTSSYITSSSPVPNIVLTASPIIPTELTSQASSPAPNSSTKPTSSPKPTVPNELDERVGLPTPAGTSCATTNNTGLNNLIRQARQLLPLERLRNILITAIVNDSAVQNLRTLLSSEDFRGKVARLHAVSEYAALTEYICKKLQLDYGLYIEFVRLVMGIRLDVDQAVDSSTPITNPRPGVRGLLLDLREALPREQLRALNRRLTFTDRDLITAVRRILSSEFRRLLRAYRQRPEFREVFGALEKAGASSRPIQQLLGTAFGMSTLLDTGAETTIINV